MRLRVVDTVTESLDVGPFPGPSLFRILFSDKMPRVCRWLMELNYRNGATS